MKKLTLSYPSAIIESIDKDNGYCGIRYESEDGDPYIVIEGNMTEDQLKDDYPLCLCSDLEIDEFADQLKRILNQK